MDAPKICIVGAGFGGLTAAITLKRELNCHNIVIYDKNDDVGGAWLTNVYPDCACDFPSHFYSWSFEPNPEWTKNYADQSEIQEYMHRAAKKYDLYSKFQCSTQVDSLTWDSTQSMWRVDITKLKTGETQSNYFNFVYIGVSFLWHPSEPDLFKGFEGRTVHTGKWDLEEHEYTGKVVGIVGSGSSAIQVLPAIAEKASTVHSFQRHASWVLPKDGREYSRWQQLIWKYVPFALKLTRWITFWIFMYLSDVLKNVSNLREKVTTTCKNIIQKECPDKFEKLVPNYLFGCKILSFSSKFYKALALPTVQLHTESITKSEGNEIHLEGKTDPIKLDVLILATGYQADAFFSPMKIYGLDGEDIGTKWKEDRPQVFLGNTSSATPNLFFVLGPYGTVAATSAIYSMECGVNWSILILKYMKKYQHKVFTVTEQAQNEFMKEIDEAYKRIIIPALNCKSFLVNDRNVPIVAFPGSAVQYWRKTRSIQPQQYVFS